MTRELRAEVLRRAILDIGDHEADTPALRRLLGVPTDASWCVAWLYQLFAAAFDALGMSKPLPRVGTPRGLWLALPDARVAVEDLAPGDIWLGKDHAGLVEFPCLDLGCFDDISGDVSITGEPGGTHVARATRSSAMITLGVLRP